MSERKKKPLSLKAAMDSEWVCKRGETSPGRYTRHVLGDSLKIAVSAIETTRRAYSMLILALTVLEAVYSLRFLSFY